MSDKGAELNRRVGVLFERAGFKSMPNSASTAEFVVTRHGKKRPVDLYATDEMLGVTIVGSNKAGGVQGGFSSHLDAFKSLADDAKADAALLVVTGHAVSEDDRTAAKAAEIFLWTESELSYFEALTDAVHSYAKYEIVNTFGLETNEEKPTHNFLAIQINQPTSSSEIELFMFAMNPDSLLKTCAIFRRALGNAEAYQRMVSKKRLPGIKDFVSKADATLPTNIVVSLDSSKIQVTELEKASTRANLTSKPITFARKDKLVALSIPMEYGAMELLDGQHRLFGFAEANFLTRRDFNLVVVGIRGLTQKQKQSAFVAINDNSRRMDPNLVAYLQLEMDDSVCQKDNKLMAIRVTVELSKRKVFIRCLRSLRKTLGVLRRRRDRCWSRGPSHEGTTGSDVERPRVL